MIKFLINRPVAVIVVFVALVSLGLLAAKHVPISPLPNINIPEITVHINKHNTSAIELESSVVQNLRMQLQQVNALNSIHTETRDNYSIVKMRFNYGADINFAFIEVNEKIDMLMNDFPSGMERPRVVKANASDVPVFYVNMSFADAIGNEPDVTRFLELSELASQVIKRRLEQLPEIALVDISGLRSAEILVQPDLAAMSALKMSAADFKTLMDENNLLFGNIVVKEGLLEYTVHLNQQKAQSIEELQNISFKYFDKIFKIKDVARITLKANNSTGIFIANNQKAISMAIIKQPQAKLSDLREATKKIIEQFKNDYPELKFDQTLDQTQLLEFSIDNLKQDLIYGSALAFLMMFFFLRNIRAPLLIGISIPISLILSMLVFKLMNISINIISLSGLVLGVGLMIDNSIIVIDNIHQFRERDFKLSEACIQGGSTIIRPLLSSALTTCSVFLPLMFLSGISGALFYDQAMAITIGLGISLIISVTLLPVLYRLFHLNARPVIVEQKKKLFFFERLYECGFHWTFDHKWISIGIVISLILVNIFLFYHLPKKKLPDFEQTEVFVAIDWNKNISLTENEIRVKKLVSTLKRQIEKSHAQIGQQQYLFGREKEMTASEVSIYLKSPDKNKLKILQDKVRTFLAEFYPDATFNFSAPKSIFEIVFGEDEKKFVLEFSKKGGGGLPEIDEIEHVKSQLVNRFPGILLSKELLKTSLVLNLNTEKMVLYDFTPEEVFEYLKFSLDSKDIGILSKGQHELPIILSNDMKDFSSDFYKLKFKNSVGIEYPVSSLINVTTRQSSRIVYGGIKGNFIPVSVEGQNPEKVISFLNANVQTPDMDIHFSGSFFSNEKLVKEMAVVIGIAILLLYFILAAQFESLIQPLIVLFELPISMAGALIMLFTFGSSINLISMIGLVVMCGIIINDSILKIDTINQLRKSGKYTLLEAIHTAGIRRLKSIVMTSLTTILSVAPFLFGNDIGSLLQRPLSLTLIGGMLIGTPISLYFIPLIYWLYYKDKPQKISVIHPPGQ